MAVATCLAGIGYALFSSSPATPLGATSTPQRAPSPGVSPASGPAGQSLTPSSAAMPGAGPVPAVPEGYTQVFLDNFGGAAGSPPSELNWLYDLGTNWGNNQVENDTSSTGNIYLDGHGDLVIQANRDSKGAWTSGRIESTRGDFIAPPGGRLEMTASLQQPDVPDEAGYWPAFWALGTPGRTGGQWPAIGEIDMIEDVNGHNAASQTLHYTGGEPDTPLTPCPDTTTTCQGGFHTYTVIIDRTNQEAEFVQFLMDGKVELTIHEAQAGTGPWQAAIDHGFYILLNLAMGGSYPDRECNCTTPTSATTSGGAMKVAYAAVYEQGTNSTPTATAAATGKITGPQDTCLANMGSVNAGYNGVTAAPCDGSPGQLWQTYTDGSLRTQGGCLDLPNGKRASGTGVQWWPCDADPSQVWQPRPNGELYNPSSGRCLTNSGNYLGIEPCHSTPRQHWTLP